MMFHGMRGLGQDDSGSTFDPTQGYDPATGETTSIGIDNSTMPSLPAGATVTTGLYSPSSASGDVSSLPTGSASSGFNWGILASIIPSLAQTAGATTASVLNAGQTTQQVQAASAAQIAASQASAASSSSFMVIGIAAIAAIGLIMAMKGK